MKNQITEEFTYEMNKRDEKIKQEFDKAILLKHIFELKKQNVANQSDIKKLEQQGWRQCLMFEGVPTEKHKISDKVLSK